VPQSTLHPFRRRRPGSFDTDKVPIYCLKAPYYRQATVRFRARGTLSRLRESGLASPVPVKKTAKKMTLTADMVT